MSAALDMLAVEAQLEAAAGTSTQPADSSDPGQRSAAASSNGVAADGFYSSGKGGTWKAFKKMVKHKKEGSSEVCSSCTAPPPATSHVVQAAPSNAASRFTATQIALSTTYMPEGL
jgi:hypothetical protein